MSRRIALRWRRFNRFLIHELTNLRSQSSNVRVYSTVTGTRQDGKAFDSRYWGANLRQPVLFATAVQQALADGFNTFIEIGPIQFYWQQLNRICSMWD